MRQSIKVDKGHEAIQSVGKVLRYVDLKLSRMTWPEKINPVFVS